MPLDDEDDRPEADDEQPLVVVLKDGDLTKEEYEAHKKATGSHGNQSGMKSFIPWATLVLALGGEKEDLWSSYFCELGCLHFLSNM